MSIIETKNYRGHRIEVGQDEFCSNPYDDCETAEEFNLFDHRQSNSAHWFIEKLGWCGPVTRATVNKFISVGAGSYRDWHSQCAADWDAFQRYESLGDYIAFCFENLRYYDGLLEAAIELLESHNNLFIWFGLNRYCGPSECAPKDADGVVYMPPEKVMSEFCGDEVRAMKSMKSMFDSYLAWAKGECYEYSIYKRDEYVGGCCGFIGNEIEEIVKEAEEEVDGLIRDKARRRAALRKG